MTPEQMRGKAMDLFREAMRLEEQALQERRRQDREREFERALANLDPDWADPVDAKAKIDAIYARFEQVVEERLVPIMVEALLAEAAVVAHATVATGGDDVAAYELARSWGCARVGEMIGELDGLDSLIDA